jgi:hypothetical protein
MLDPSLIEEARAKDAIAEIEDSAVRVPISLLVESLVAFYQAQPARLRRSFDLLFFVNVLKERIDDISGLLRGTVPVEYWFDDYPKPEIEDEASDSSPTGLRQRQAFNYAARHPDGQVQAALLGLTARANLKQALLMPNVKGYKAHGLAPPLPEAPLCHLISCSWSRRWISP